MVCDADIVCIYLSLNLRLRAKIEQLSTFQRILPESQGPNLAMSDLYVPYSLDRATDSASVRSKNGLVGRYQIQPPFW